MISVNLLADAAVLETLVPLLEDEGATVSAHEFLFELQEDTVRNSDVLMVTSEFDQQKAVMSGYVCGVITRNCY